MFGKVRAALEAGQWIVSFSGFKVRAGPNFTHAWGGQTCFSVTPRLLRLVEAHGIHLDQVSEHFSAGRLPPPASREQLVVRARVQKDEEGRRLAKRDLPIAEGDERAEALREELKELNAFLAEQDIRGFAFGGLRRVFSDGDQPGFAWQWGGRFYSMPGADTYENWKGKRAARAKAITIQGERVTEVDISAAHLSILYTLRNVPFDPRADPYSVAGVKTRDMVKRWLMLALGSGSVARRGQWFSKVREATLEKHPVLNGLDSYGIGTLDLQHHEAEVMLRAMKVLRDRYGIASLPVHDSLVVPASKELLVRDVLAEAFRSYFSDEVGMTVDNLPRLS